MRRNFWQVVSGVLVIAVACRNLKTSMSESVVQFDNPSAPSLQRYDAWLRTIPASSTTGWRWRKENMIRTLNIAGRVYVSSDAIAEFLTRAERGEFAQEHKTPAPPARDA